MRTVELFEHGCQVARELGYEIRQEWLGGSGGGACEFAGKRWIFIDLALTAVEQLDQLTEALAKDARIDSCRMPAEVRRLVKPRRAA